MRPVAVHADAARVFVVVHVPADVGASLQNENVAAAIGEPAREDGAREPRSHDQVVGLHRFSSDCGAIIHRGGGRPAAARPPG